MVLRAVQGALAFLTRLPVGGGGRAWDAFRTTPAALPLAGYVVGALAGAAFLLPVPAPTAVAGYLAALYLLSGPTHADGLADVGDAAAVHGDPERRRAVLKDSETGVGGTLALVFAVVLLALGALAAAGTAPVVALAVALGAEVGAKAGMATLVCLGSPAHEGLGSQLVAESDVVALVPVALALLPAVVAVALVSSPAVAVATLSAGPAVAFGVRRWARPRLGGVSGDVLGTTNELGRLAGLHVGVVAWTLL